MYAETESRDVVILVDGVFDRAAALAICAALREQACDEVVLDFSQARDISDAALAVLARSIANLQYPHVILRGLRQHHERVLGYLRA